MKSSSTVSGIEKGLFFLFWGLCALYFILPHGIVKALLLIVLMIFGWQLYLGGCFLISKSLRGTRKKKFNIYVSLVTPAVASLYFLKDMEEFSSPEFFSRVNSPWILFFVGIIGYLSWAAAEQASVEHPHRAFLFSALILFGLCWFKYQGSYTDFDEVDDTAYSFVNLEEARLAAQTGNVFPYFLFCVSVSYACILLRFKMSWEAMKRKTIFERRLNRAARRQAGRVKSE